MKERIPSTKPFENVHPKIRWQQVDSGERSFTFSERRVFQRWQELGPHTSGVAVIRATSDRDEISGKRILAVSAAGKSSVDPMNPSRFAAGKHVATNARRLLIQTKEGGRESRALRLGNGFGDQSCRHENHDKNLRHHRFDACASLRPDLVMAPPGWR